jgi:small subunit ribosomal protein S3
MQNGALGVKIQLSGRLGGAEMSRTLDSRLGKIPLSTLQANVDYAVVHAFTTSGALGVKVWVYKGMYSQDQQDEVVSNAAGGRARARGRR